MFLLLEEEVLLLLDINDKDAKILSINFSAEFISELNFAGGSHALQIKEYLE